MPHQCTNCGHAFPDGSKEMLSGCPECGGNKFQFRPEGASGDTSEGTPEPPEPPESEGGSVTSAVGKAAASVRDTLSSGPDTGSKSESGPGTESDQDSEPASGTESDSGPGTGPGHDTDRGSPASEETGGADDGEDTAQADARSEMVSDDDLPPKPDRDGTVVQEPSSDERPDMEALRQELNSQFESIKVVAPGQYELNLMELYDREEYIIALQENGRYVIEVPESWRADDEDG